jgi:hypothetical protein
MALTRHEEEIATIVRQVGCTWVQAELAFQDWETRRWAEDSEEVEEDVDMEQEAPELVLRARKGIGSY